MKIIKFYGFTLIFLVSIITGCGQDNPCSEIINNNSGNQIDAPASPNKVITTPKNHKVLLVKDNVKVIEVIHSTGKVKIVFIVDDQVCYTFWKPNIF
ncbi:hypothetical protein [Bizionia arctica]|uniref:Uncharacterized protein n=1 Tax=Bizionia arctica TaxID=1495645 RepID=A0A917GUZ8_9FLAO|nr:hypothetical protein [Bizionia arctica]GGG57192.1 hypothetical protein GCM10010976_30040 [Bizionia arctica]